MTITVADQGLLVTMRATKHFTDSVRRDLYAHETWNIGLVYEPISTFAEGEATHTIHWLSPPSNDRYYADPFGLERNGSLYILCEEFDYRSNKGRIISIEMKQKKYESTPRVAMEFPFHTSYPYLIESRGEIYCIPETARAMEIALYRSVDFPCRWEKVSTLVPRFPARDATVFEHNGLWWLTCSGSPTTPDLYAWYSSDLLGPWVPHPSNPVKKDPSSSRPAGTPFVCDGILYRPAQDCSRTYGGRIILNRVRVLTTDAFKEDSATVIEPNVSGPYPHGLHTISAAGDVTLIDGKRNEFIGFKGIMARLMIGIRDHVREQTAQAET
jgi:hypothetical protein